MSTVHARSKLPYPNDLHHKKNNKQTNKQSNKQTKNLVRMGKTVSVFDYSASWVDVSKCEIESS